MFPRDVSKGPVGPRGVSRFLGAQELVVYVTRRHSVVLGKAFTIWLATFALGALAVVNSGAGSAPREIGGLLLLAGTTYMGWNVWRWRMARYVFTSDRVLFFDGIVGRRINGLPLKVVLDTTFHQTPAGRIFGYCDLDLNLSGQPGLRKLSYLPKPDTIYHLVLSLIGERRPPQAPSPGIRSVR